MLNILYFLSFLYIVNGQFGIPISNGVYQRAIVTFTSFQNGTQVSLPLELSSGIVGVFGSHSPRRNASGYIYIPKDDHYGCEANYDDVNQSEKFIALLSRGECRFYDKISNAQDNNATAVIIYDYQSTRIPITMSHEGADKIVAISITHQSSTYIDNILQSGGKLLATIVPGNSENTTTNNTIKFERTSVIFVSVSFMILMIVSLAWLVFYYIQKFRMARSQILRERHVYYFQRRQREYFRQMLSKLPSRTLKESDELLNNVESVCAICLDPYKVGDHVRELSCKHCFHRRCVDPWLRSNRTCPMCKVNIIKSLGIPDLDSPSSHSIDEHVILHTAATNQIHSNEGTSTEEGPHNTAVVSISSEALYLTDRSNQRDNFPNDSKRSLNV